jgi:hypothetical protein
VPDDPLAPIRPALQAVRFQAEQLLQTLVANPVGSRGAQGAVVQEAFGVAGGVISHELFGRRRTGSRIARAWVTDTQRKQQAVSRQNARNEALLVVKQARSLVSSVSQKIGSRYAQSLSRGLADAEAAHRPDTILRKVLQTVGRLEAFRPPRQMSIEAPTFPTALRDLEDGLRKCIEDCLSLLAHNWWVERVPDEIRSQAERRKVNRERVWPWLEAGEHPVVEYLGFPDYAKIIFEPVNWEQAFSPIFVDAEALRVKLRELEPIRTDVAHSRKLSLIHQRRLETYAEDILTAIRSRSLRLAT